MRTRAKKQEAPAVKFSAGERCKCGCQRRDHVHGTQANQHTPMAADAPRDCLGPCLGHYEGEVWTKCAGFAVARGAGR